MDIIFLPTDLLFNVQILLVFATLFTAQVDGVTVKRRIKYLLLHIYKMITERLSL